jgi:three-Cys-motif partner protein
MGEDKAHQFGSVHTILKLAAISSYLPAYTTALKNLPFTLHYIDAFAGAGMCEITVGDLQVTVPGSASFAIECTPAFHKMVFIEKSRKRARALEKLKAAAPHRDITIVRDDANRALPDYLSKLNPKRDRAIVFLDPHGMQVEWSTLERIAESKLVDLWYLFPLSAFYRQASRSASAVDASKAAALTRIAGTDEWRRQLYARPRQNVLFEDERPDMREGGTKEILDWFKRKLETIFPGVSNPKVLHRTTTSGKAGAPIFALFFAVANPSPKAIPLALRIAEGVLKLKLETRPKSAAAASGRPPSSLD